MPPNNDSVTRFANPMDTIGAQCICQDILVEDISPSMAGHGFEPGKTKIGLMYEASVSFLNTKLAQRPQDKVAVVTFDAKGQERCGLLNVATYYSRILAAMEKASVISGGGTCIQSALRIALKLVEGSRWLHPAGSAEVITRVLSYSDGEDQSKAEALRYASQLKELGVVIWTFGIGERRTCVDERFLRSIATETDGVKNYRFLGDGDAIRQTFTKLATGMLVFEG